MTGAARGIGLATAKRFLADGWRVALLDIDGENLQRTFAAIDKPDVTLAIHCDVADAAGVARALDIVAKQFGRLDALVNNAGIAIFKPILDVTYEDWSRVLAVNLTGPFLCTQAAAPLMRDSGGGAIVNITSISGLRASTLRTAYGTSKAGLAHLTKQQAAELAPLGIRVNAVAPGPVDTAMAKAVHTPEIRAALSRRTCRSTATAWKKNWRKRSFSCAASARATSPDRRCASTAASIATGIGLPTLRRGHSAISSASARARSARRNCGDSLRSRSISTRPERVM